MVWERRASSRNTHDLPKNAQIKPKTHVIHAANKKIQKARHPVSFDVVEESMLRSISRATSGDQIGWARYLGLLASDIVYDHFFLPLLVYLALLLFLKLPRAVHRIISDRPQSTAPCREVWPTQRKSVVEKKYGHKRITTNMDSPRGSNQNLM